MSEEQRGAAAEETVEAESSWRKRLRELGRQAFQEAEMVRLGFWPTSREAQEKVAQARAELELLRQQMAPLQQETRQLRGEIGRASNVQALLNEIRRKRIERVRAERAVRKEQRIRERDEKAAQYAKWRSQTLPHLGREVSQGLHYEGGDDEKLTRLGLPILHSAAEVAQAMEIEPRQLAWLTYHRGASFIDHYHHFTIPKKSGGTRNISSPKSKLRAAQSWLLHEVLEKLEVHAAAAAFRPGLNIRDNAAQHAGRARVLRIDLKDFFPSIGFKRVKRLFQSFGYNEGVASIFALLATEAPRVAMALDGKKYHVAIGDRALPQGACTSPAITNILCRNLDARLSGAARKLGFAYTRYADDLVFSTDESEGDPIGKMLGFARDIITGCGFVINEEKITVMRQSGRQAVTGLVVNAQSAAGPRVSRHDLKRFRAFLHRYETLGRAAMTEQLGRDALAHARGYLSFIHMVSPAQAEKIRAAHPWLQKTD